MILGGEAMGCQINEGAGSCTTRFELSSMKDEMIFFRVVDALRAVGVALNAVFDDVSSLLLLLDAPNFGRSRMERACRATRLQTKHACWLDGSRRGVDCPASLARILRQRL